MLTLDGSLGTGPVQGWEWIGTLKVGARATEAVTIGGEARELDKFVTEPVRRFVMVGAVTRAALAETLWSTEEVGFGAGEGDFNRDVSRGDVP